VYINTLATVQGQIEQAENPMPAVVISVEAARVDNATAKCKSVRKPHANLPNTPVDLTGAPK
jgi:hypothetical protein